MYSQMNLESSIHWLLKVVKTGHSDAIHLLGERYASRRVLIAILVVAKNPISNLMRTYNYVFQNKIMKILKINNNTLAKVQ